jgi:hypothetical protein
VKHREGDTGERLRRTFNRRIRDVHQKLKRLSAKRKALEDRHADLLDRFSRLGALRADAARQEPNRARIGEIERGCDRAFVSAERARVAGVPPVTDRSLPDR